MKFKVNQNGNIIVLIQKMFKIQINFLIYKMLKHNNKHNSLHNHKI